MLPTVSLLTILTFNFISRINRKIPILITSTIFPITQTLFYRKITLNPIFYQWLWRRWQLWNETSYTQAP